MTDEPGPVPVPQRLGDVETERLLLRRWDPARVDDAFAAINALPEVTRHLTGGAPLARAESDELSARIADHWATFGFGLWSAFEKPGGRMVGFVGLQHPRWFPARAAEVEVGWRLHPDVWGRGYATEGGRAALEVGFGQLALDRIVAFVDPANDRSAAVARRLGMTLEETSTNPNTARQLLVFGVERRG